MTVQEQLPYYSYHQTLGLDKMETTVRRKSVVQLLYTDQTPELKHKSSGTYFESRSLSTPLNVLHLGAESESSYKNSRNTLSKIADLNAESIQNNRVDNDQESALTKLNKIAKNLLTLRDNVELQLRDESFLKYGAFHEVDGDGSDIHIEHSIERRQEDKALAILLREFDTKQLKLNYIDMNYEISKLISLLSIIIRNQQGSERVDTLKVYSKVPSERLAQEHNNLLAQNKALILTIETSKETLKSSERLHQQSLQAYDAAIADELKMVEQQRDLASDLTKLHGRISDSDRYIRKLEKQKLFYQNVLMKDSRSFLHRIAITFGHWRGVAIMMARHNSIISFWSSSRQKQHSTTLMKHAVYAFKRNASRFAEKKSFFRKLAQKLRVSHLYNYFRRWKRVTLKRHNRNFVAKRLHKKWMDNLYICSFHKWKKVYMDSSKEDHLHDLLVNREIQWKKRTITMQCFVMLRKNMGTNRRIKRQTFFLWLKNCEKQNLHDRMLDAFVADHLISSSFVKWKTLSRQNAIKMNVLSIMLSRLSITSRCQFLKYFYRKWRCFVIVDSLPLEHIISNFRSYALGRNLRFSFVNWHDHVLSIRKQRMVAHKFMNRLINRMLYLSFNSWYKSVTEMLRLDGILKSCIKNMKRVKYRTYFYCWKGNSLLLLKQRLSVQNLVYRIKYRLLVTCFKKWHSQAASSSYLNVLLSRLIIRWKKVRLRTAFGFWKRRTATTARGRAISSSVISHLHKRKVMTAWRFWYQVTKNGKELQLNTVIGNLAELAARKSYLHRKLVSCFATWRRKMTKKRIAKTQRNRILSMRSFHFWKHYSATRVVHGRFLQRFNLKKRRTARCLVAWFEYSRLAKTRQILLGKYRNAKNHSNLKKYLSAWRMQIGQVREMFSTITAAVRRSQVLDMKLSCWRRWKIRLRIGKIGRFIGRAPQRYSIGCLARYFYKWTSWSMCCVVETGLRLVREKVAVLESSIYQLECSFDDSDNTVDKTDDSKFQCLLKLKESIKNSMDVLSHQRALFKRVRVFRNALKTLETDYDHLKTRDYIKASEIDKDDDDLDIIGELISTAGKASTLLMDTDGNSQLLQALSGRRLSTESLDNHRGRYASMFKRSPSKVGISSLDDAKKRLSFDDSFSSPKKSHSLVHRFADDMSIPYPSESRSSLQSRSHTFSVAELKKRKKKLPLENFLEGRWIP